VKLRNEINVCNSRIGPFVIICLRSKKSKKLFGVEQNERF
jgi:hypothetical protein